ncbi:MAG: protein kinase domain-containing protein, partial [Bacteroidota bacterium]
SSSDQDKARFIQEAKAASALDHPNICNVHEIDETPDGQVFIVMAVYDGTPLNRKIEKGPLKIEEALDIAIQAAEGLQAAHEKGITHRDVKSSNIMVTEKGRAVIMDFGLARTSAATKLTKAGATLGTVPYMSPEQARGEKVDHRADIWSLGVVLYEMISGRLPFKSDYNEATVYSILNESAAPLTSLRSDVPMELERIVNKTLAKKPGERYQNVTDLLVDLRKLSQGTEAGISGPQSSKSFALRKNPTVIVASLLGLAALALTLYFLVPSSPTKMERKSIAVLLFKNLSDSKEDEYFSDGLTEDIITQISKISDVKVISRTSVVRYKNTDKSLRTIGNELSVATILEGSVRRSGNQVRIVAQLIDANTDEHLWAETYDRQLTEIFAIQSDIARQIASALRAKLVLSGDARTRGQPTQNFEAYEYYLRGKFHFNISNRAGVDSSIILFQRAVELDPTFGLAYASLAQAYHEWYSTYDARKEWDEKAFVAVEKALTLDPNLAEAYLARGLIYWGQFNRTQPERGLQELRRAIELNPNLSGAHEYLGAIYGHIGLLEEALVEAKKSVELNPANVEHQYRVGQVLLYQQQYAEALSVFETVKEVYNPGFVSSQKGIILWYLGREKDAWQLLKDALTKYPEDRFLNSTFAIMLAARGEEKEAEARIQNALERGKGFGDYHHVAYYAGSMYAFLKKNKQAVQWLQTAADNGFPCYPLYEKDPNLDLLRNDPMFIQFMAELKNRWEGYKATL